MFALIGWALISISLSGMTAAAEPYGPSGVLGPAGASTRSCSGAPNNCYVCTPGSCTPSGSWQSVIEGADPGATVLLRAGTYDPSGTLDIPAGTASSPITIANFNGEVPTIAGPIAFGSGHVRMEGLIVDSPTSSYAISIQSMNSSLKSDIELKNMDVMGGTIEGIRIRGNVEDITIRNSLLDGGRDHHVIKVLCDAETSSGCSFTPEDILIANNRLSKVRSSFFPKSHCCDEADGGSGDLLQLEGTGDVAVIHNAFGQSDYENCLDIKRTGRSGAILTIKNNILDGRHNASGHPTTEPGCRFGGLLMIQPNPNGTDLVEGNLILGRGNLIRGTATGGRVINNIFDGGDLTIASPNARVTLGYNTFMNAGNRMIFGDSTGLPGNLKVINNIFAQTRFMGASGSYQPSNNLLFDTSGSTLGSCPTCISGDPLLSGYEIKEGSPAMDAASTSFTVATDIDQTSRPQAAGPDIGAYEFTGTQSSPPPPEPEPEPEPEPAPPEQQRFADNLIPGVIEAEDYDLGGEGVAYHDETGGNAGSAYRDDDVDIKANVYDSGHSVGWMQVGEWLEYTVNVQEAGQYRLRANVGTIQSDGPNFTLFVDGTPVATVIAPSTGSWDVKQLVEVADLPLTAGEHLLRIEVNQRWLDVDYLDFSPVDDSPPLPEDIVAPDVEILEPADGATVRRRSRVPIRLAASDDESGVDSVILRIEGEVAAQFFGDGEYTHTWRPRGRRDRLAVIEVTATDFAGHIATDSITLEVTR